MKPLRTELPPNTLVGLSRLVAALAAGAIPYLLRPAPVSAVEALGSLVLGRDDFAWTWLDWSNRTTYVRELLGPWMMGHLSDGALAFATATFVGLMQAEATRKTRLAWHLGALTVLLGLELLQRPLGFGTFDVQDLVVIVLGYAAANLHACCTELWSCAPKLPPRLPPQRLVREGE